MFLIFLRFIPFQYKTTSSKEWTFKKFICKGWTCDSEKYYQHQIDEFENIINDYANWAIDKEFPNMIMDLLNRGFEPSL